MLALFSFDLQAALPTPVAPSTAPAAGDWLALIEGYVKDSGLVLGLFNFVQESEKVALIDFPGAYKFSLSIVKKLESK